MATKTEWRDRASGFFAVSSMKIRNATQTAGIFVGDVAKDAGTGVAEVAEMAAEVAERAGFAVRSRWSLLQKSRQDSVYKGYSQDSTVQERFKSAASSTSVLLKRSLQETKEVMAVGRTRMEQAAKRAAQQSKIMFEKWQKGQSGANVFGASLETVVQRQRSSKAIPQIVINCVDYLTASGLSAENIFKSNGNQSVVQNLRYRFEQDWNMIIPEGTNPVDVAALLKRYLQMLPEPLLTHAIYNEIKEARGNVQKLADLVRTIPYAHYSTLECLTSLLWRIAQKSTSNKMDAHSLAFELAPYLLWKQNIGTHTGHQSRVSHDKALNSTRNEESDILGVDSVIPLDDEPMMADFAIIEAVQCLIEQQKVIFADATEAFLQESV
ncbi:hypothetical protein KP509_07G087200 [Ceratopteris richardii]|uniref:Rho-GAP domain-containing protein n=1 Tax=Ceratopteris richardii TaxID=49495 RepID=A0A8T2UIY2_CERRI|nr:hypothetical protein KP509_07G087200 [Ceratopteris richardii]KAH7433806.1 hypothetical protein KP509_07G087200 [Ceratopteris richardii]KAH7433807.1 hypothetical protein KP509_07G087200 [Ceratopteris richardii]KAH7433808.1 hypothetical protein KP509_07G087200 [Ceratopteris richardii]